MEKQRKSVDEMQQPLLGTYSPGTTVNVVPVDADTSSCVCLCCTTGVPISDGTSPNGNNLYEIPGKGNCTEFT